MHLREGGHGIAFSISIYTLHEGAMFYCLYSELGALGRDGALFLWRYSAGGVSCRIEMLF